MPVISVIVPVHNMEMYLDRCIDSILSQTLKDFELVLIDDGSTDTSGSICNKYAEIDKRIIVIHQKNQGLSAARNAGLEWLFNNSESEWICFIDSDDWIHSQYLEVLYDVVNRTNTKVAICEYLRTKEDAILNEIGEGKAEIITPEELFLKRTLFVILVWGKIYHRDLWKNYRFPIGKIREDEFMTWKILFSLEEVSVVHEKLYIYYQHNQSIMHKAWTKQHLDVLEALDEQMLYYKDNSYEKAFYYSVARYIYYLIECLENLNRYYPKDKEIQILKKRLKDLYRGYKHNLDFSIQDRMLINEKILPININLISWVIKKKKHLMKLYNQEGICGVINKIRNIF